MKRLLALCLLLFAFAGSGAFAQDAAPARDFNAERLAMANAPDYNGYALSMGEQNAASAYIALARDRNATPEARQAALDTMLQKYPLSIVAHGIAGKHYRDLAQSSEPANPELLAKFEYHRATMRAIVDGILAGGDGKTQATAWTVIHTGEEYTVMELLGLEVKDQALIMGDNGKPYDLFTVTDETGKEFGVFFDISSFFGKGFGNLDDQPHDQPDDKKAEPKSGDKP